MKVKFVPLHVKSDYSLGYGTASVDELVEAAAAAGYRMFALTDLENLYGQVSFHHQCRLHGIRPIAGVELRPGFDGRRNVGNRAGRVVLLALNERGYGNLCRIVSSRRGGTPHRTKETGEDPLRLVAFHGEGLIALSDDPSVVEKLMEVMPRERLGILLVRPDDAAVDKARMEAASRLGVQLVADIDAVFLRPDDHQLHQLQLAIRQNTRVEEVATGNEAEGRERWLRPVADVEALFADIPEALTATAEIADRCGFDITAIATGFTPLTLPVKKDIQDQLRQLCEEGIGGLFSNGHTWTEGHQKRLDDELATIEKLGFSDFMLTAAEILSHCKREGIPTIVRGSAVSSLALHLLGASPVDPLSHGLIFQRFLHSRKTAWPDVDIDLPWHRRDEVIEWVYERYGRDRVAMVAAHHTIQHRSALQEGLKAYGVRPVLIERLARALPHEDLLVEEVDFLGLAETAKEWDPEAAPLAQNEETAPLADILPNIRRLVGRPHHISVHPGGIVVSRHPLEEILPLERAPKGVVITQYDLVAVAKLGLVKIDLLGNRCLSELEEALMLVGYPQPLRLQSIPADDPQTLSLIDRAATMGCFQLESPAMRSLLARLPIRHQSQITAALSLIRPGAAAGEVKTDFIRRAHGEKQPDDILFPLMADRLRETYGLFLYEEDIMVLLARVGGLTLEEADEVRKGIVESGGDVTVLSSLEKDFMESAKGHGETEEVAKQAWTTAARFAAYSFNKAHAASYAFLAYLSAYTKAHHPVEFTCALLNHHQGVYPLRAEAAELVRMGIELRGPHVNESDYHTSRERHKKQGGPDAVRVGLDKIKNLSLRGTAKLLQARAERGAFLTVRELLERVRLSQLEITALVLSGACDGLVPLTTADYPFAHQAILEVLKQRHNPAELDSLPIPKPAVMDEKTKLFQGLVRVRNELNFLELHLTAHPMELLRPEASRYRCLSINKAVSSPAGAWLGLAVIISAMRRVPTKQGPMQFLTLEDETGLLEGALLPPAYRRIGDIVKTPGPYLVEGKLRQQQGAVHLDVIKVAPFHERRRPFGRWSNGSKSAE